MQGWEIGNKIRLMTSVHLKSGSLTQTGCLLKQSFKDKEKKLTVFHAVHRIHTRLSITSQCSPAFLFYAGNNTLAVGPTTLGTAIVFLNTLE